MAELIPFVILWAITGAWLLYDAVCTVREAREHDEWLARQRHD